MCAFILDKRIFGFLKDVLYVCVYTPPEGSPFYAHFDYDQGITILEDCLTDLLLSLDDVYIIVCGDLNSRTSNLSPSLSVIDHSQFQFISQSIASKRRSQDTSINAYGKSLLNMCTALDLVILNGLCNGDREGRYTYTSESGSSVNDYFILSNDFHECVYGICDLHVADRSESDHFPVEYRIVFSKDVTARTEDDNVVQVIEKFVWKEESSQEFYRKLCDTHIHDNLQAAIQMIDVNVNEALKLFNDCIKDCAASMKKTISMNSNKHQEGWFDEECKQSRTNVRSLLRKFRKTKDKDDNSSFVKARREYKNMLIKKRKQFNKNSLNKLMTSINNQKEFWDCMKNISFKNRQPKNDISVDNWFQHFKALLDTDLPCDNNDDEELDVENELMNRPISREEVVIALRKIKNRKAAGPDGIIGEFLKTSCEKVVDFFVTFLNALFDKGIFPDYWCESITFPLYKKGDANNTNNYRGISISDIGSKVFSTIINRRLQEFVEDNNITGEHQAGFKRGYSTIDHMFTLLALIQKQFSFNRKLYVAFIDFEKAFDSINRNLLWPILIKNGIRGKLFKCVKSMYNTVKTRVRCGGKLTDYINCTRGVKQGDVCSPVLFSLFINELTIEVINKGRHGARFTIDFMELFIMLLADDVVLFSETVVGLQTQLNNLKNSADKLQLRVNMDKSNIIVFRKGGYLAARERWRYNDIVMPVVNAYKYLGIFFSTRLSFVAACRDLSSKAKNVLFHVMKKLFILNNTSLELFVQILYVQIQPIVQYGSELWGLDRRAVVHCESVHVFTLNVSGCRHKNTE
jgi:hypothetical protein